MPLTFANIARGLVPPGKSTGAPRLPVGGARKMMSAVARRNNRGPVATPAGHFFATYAP
jgi:hypothetical protein